ncbi:uncharacterized protein VP01_2541g1 [Puccinia sorghi]|uniref:Retrovirus-related Pol polyprotein from transposon TNT 1-94-like beta-barrel domain-containing protein n=1 Tax=Puccinia sorghi TaxID=27349 RepID=A0A0L6V561_9BASI|nr:uncharacterized protein VP01_2541g1 [Puccinia sorghi]
MRVTNLLDHDHIIQPSFPVVFLLSFIPVSLSFILVNLFLDELYARLSSLAAVGLVVGNPQKANIKESLLAEAILAKLTGKFSSVKEILYQKRPLTIATIRECLDGKHREAEAPFSAAITVKQDSYPQCSPGWHNPATTGHTKHKSQPKLGSDSLSIATEASRFICIRKALSAVVSKDTCFLDSGASHHMFSDRSKFTFYKDRKTLIELADGNTLESVGEGYVHIVSKDKSTFRLKALHVPELAGTLISFGRLYERGCEVVRTGKLIFDLVKENSILLSAKVIDGTCNVTLKSRRTPKQQGS